jgi:hypothetical protein
MAARAGSLTIYLGVKSLQRETLQRWHEASGAGLEPEKKARISAYFRLFTVISAYF